MKRNRRSGKEKIDKLKKEKPCFWIEFLLSLNSHWNDDNDLNFSEQNHTHFLMMNDDVIVDVVVRN